MSNDKPEEIRNINNQKKHSWLNMMAIALIVSGLLLIINAIRLQYPWWQLKFKVYPYAKDEKAIVQGKKLYQQRCQSCHGPNGEFSQNNHPIIKHISMHYPSNYYQIVTNGEPKYGMPSFRNSLNSDERWKIVSYVYNNFYQPSKAAAKKSKK